MTQSTPEPYQLEFTIPPDLYKRAITHPLPGHEKPTGVAYALRVVLVTVLMTGSIALFCLAFFDMGAFAPMTFGFVLGGFIIFALWWRQHRLLVGAHMSVAEKAEHYRYDIDASGIMAAREHIRSEISWPFVNMIRGIDGATLIEVQTARLIVPDAALDVSPDAFRAQLTDWWQA